MTIGSAASWSPRGPQAPFPAFRSFSRDRQLPSRQRPQTQTTPLRNFPRMAVADDPPRGRILVVGDQPSLVLDVQRILRDAGYRAVGPAGSPEEADRLIGRGPVDGAVIDLKLARGDGVADRLAHEGIPFVWLTDGLFDAIPWKPGFMPAVTKSAIGKDLISALERALSSGTRPDRGSFYPVPPPQEVWPRVFPQL